jgi:hypothetical protein
VIYCQPELLIFLHFSSSCVMFSSYLTDQNPLKTPLLGTQTLNLKKHHSALTLAHCPHCGFQHQLASVQKGLPGWLLEHRITSKWNGLWESARQFRAIKRLRK